MEAINKFSLYLIKPDGTEIGDRLLAHNVEIKITGNNEIGQVSFSIPELLQNDEGDTFVNPYYYVIKPGYRVRLEIDNNKPTATLDSKIYKREYKIYKPVEQTDGTKTSISYIAYSRETELNDKMITEYSGVPVNVSGSSGIVINGDGSISVTPLTNDNEFEFVYDGLNIAEVIYTLLKQLGTTWQLSYIDPDLIGVVRSNFDNIQNVRGLNVIKDVALSYDSILEFDTINKLISVHKLSNLGQDLGFTIEYGRYLKSLNKQEKVSEIITRIKPIGANGIGISDYTPGGYNFIEDYTYYLGSFQRDTGGTVLAHSEWMSDSLANALLDWEEAKSAELSNLQTLYTERDGLVVDKINLENDIAYLKIGQTLTEEFETVLVNANTTSITLSSSPQFLGIPSGIGLVEAYIGGEYKVVLFADTPTGSTPTDNFSDDKYRYGVDIIVGENYPDYGSKVLYFNSTEYPIGTKIRIRYKTLGLNQISTIKSTYENAKSLPSTSDSKKLIYQGIIDELVTLYNSIDTSIGLKISELETKEADLEVVIDEISAIKDSLSIENNFTEQQIEEWENFIREDVYQNTEISDPELLLSSAQDILNESKIPELNVDLDIISILQTRDALVDWDKLNLYDLINIRFERLNLDIQARIFEININVDNYKTTLLISTTANYIRDGQQLLNRTVDTFSKNTNTTNSKKETWNKSKSNASVLDSFKSSGISAEEYGVNAGDEELVKVDGNGITIQDKLGINESSNTPEVKSSTSNDDRYVDRIIRYKNGGIYLSKDGGKTFTTAITPEQIFADVIKGNLIVGNELLILGNDGSTDVFEVGNIDTDDSGTDDDFGIKIDGVINGNSVRILVSRDNGFKILIDEGSGFENRFSVDSDGKISAEKITIKELEVKSSTGRTILSNDKMLQTITAQRRLDEVVAPGDSCTTGYMLTAGSFTEYATLFTMVSFAVLDQSTITGVTMNFIVTVRGINNDGSEEWSKTSGLSVNNLTTNKEYPLVVPYSFETLNDTPLIEVILESNSVNTYAADIKVLGVNARIFASLY